MVYKQFQDLQLSALGMGAMRLPVIDKNDEKIDEEATAKMVKCAIEEGINYFDTAWGYHGGHSELVMGKVLSEYPRESFYLASKFPGYDLANMPKVEEIFEKQLEKCRVSYFDFYLFHSVCEMNINEYLDEKYGIYDYLMKQKADGRIRHLGFSVHGNYETMKRFLEAYGKDMEFCQIQLNYVDWDFQDAKAKVDLLNEYHIPIWVMEPLRGGKLASLSKENGERLAKLRPDEEIPAWAFRFLQSIPNIVVTLSGMSNQEQLEKNIHTFESEKPLDQEEMRTILDIADRMVNGIPCTACRYCTTHCPQEIDIPEMIKLYNEHKFTGGGFIAPMALMAVEEGKLPSACVGCGSCEAVCPQQIKISEVMSDFAGMMKG